MQISAAGVSVHAGTEFFRSKARGDAILNDSGLNWVILRPTLVLAQAAYGGTAVLRAAAAMPFVLPRLMPGSLIQVVHVDDLAEAVLAAADGRLASGSTLDVTGPDRTAFPDLLQQVRCWLGLAPAHIEIGVPFPLVRAMSKVADAAGWLGWRSPLRSNAVLALQAGITGDAETLPAAGGPVCRGLEATLAALPSTPQERWFARAYLMLPLAILILAAFWLASGAIGLARFGAATEVLTSRGMSSTIAGVAVAAGAVADLVLGGAILWRRWTRMAVSGMVILSLAYLGFGTVFAPDLWADPLGAFLKVVPGVGLAFFVLAFSEER